jgi:hypothetical protein
MTWTKGIACKPIYRLHNVSPSDSRNEAKISRNSLFPPSRHEMILEEAHVSVYHSSADILKKSFS